jgi:hypothetical protein
MEKQYFRQRLTKLRENWAAEKEDGTRNLNLKLGQIKERLNRLTDAYLDKDVDKATFEERKRSLLLDQKAVEENLLALKNSTGPDRIEKFLEHAEMPRLSHESGFPDEKRQMLKIFTSNRQVDGKNVNLEPSLAFEAVGSRFKNTGCDPRQDIPRIWDALLETSLKLNSAGQLPDLLDLLPHKDNSMNATKVKGAKLASVGMLPT